MIELARLAGSSIATHDEIPFPASTRCSEMYRDSDSAACAFGAKSASIRSRDKSEILVRMAVPTGVEPVTFGLGI